MNWTKEAEDDGSMLTSGQSVIITARWILIVGALVLTLWNPTPPPHLWVIQVQTGLLLVYAVVNFFLHAQYIRQGSQVEQVAYFTSLVDLVLITFVIAMWPSSIDSAVYVFYLPAVLAIAVAFPRAVTAAYTLGIIVAYGIVALAFNPELITAAQAQDLVVRELMIVAVAFTGALYRHIENERWHGRGKAFSFMSGSTQARTARRPAPRTAPDNAAQAATEGAE